MCLRRTHCMNRQYIPFGENGSRFNRSCLSPYVYATYSLHLHLRVRESGQACKLRRVLSCPTRLVGTERQNEHMACSPATNPRPAPNAWSTRSCAAGRRQCVPLPPLGTTRAGDTATSRPPASQDRSAHADHRKSRTPRRTQVEGRQFSGVRGGRASEPPALRSRAEGFRSAESDALQRWRLRPLICCDLRRHRTDCQAVMATCRPLWDVASLQVVRKQEA